MSKISYASMSLIGAVPGGYLSYLLVMAMLNNFSKMPGILRVVVCGIFALSAVVTLIPLGILIFVKSEKEEAEEAAKETGSVADELDDVDGEALEEIDETPAGKLPDLESAGITSSDQSVMIEHEEEIDDIYEADDDVFGEKPKSKKK